VPILRALHGVLGNRLRVFGGETMTSFADVSGLMAREPEKIDWFAGPVDDRADYLSKSYVPFLLAGPNHSLRREHIRARVAKAYTHLDDLEQLLHEEGDVERALARFLFRQLCSVELDQSEVDWFLEFRKGAQQLFLLPKWIRTTVLKSTHERVTARRLHFLQRIEAVEPIADSWLDAIWFNAATLGFYPEKALEALRKYPRLRAPILDELNLPAGQRPKTRALIHEILRIYGRLPSTNHVEQGRVRIALLATAMVDPFRYHDPYEIDLTRNHGDALAFAGAAPNRKCPAEHFAPDIMATVVAYRVREGWLQRPSSGTEHRGKSSGNGAAPS
jgi:hypothetical protein